MIDSRLKNIYMYKNLFETEIFFVIQSGKKLSLSKSVTENKENSNITKDIK